MGSVNKIELKKCVIHTVDGPDIKVEAHFNPKELSIDKSVPWNTHKATKADNYVLEFTDSQPMTLSLELFFDGFEDKVDVHDKWVKKLIQMTKIVSNAQSDEDKHPPRCIFSWSNFPKFTGVIESVQTKYSMFLPDGTPVRATCSIKMKEADELRLKSD